ncbi:hypothetical protein QEN19_000937 [Hanseniaspora menglaensis]
MNTSQQHIMSQQQPKLLQQGTLMDQQQLDMINKSNKNINGTGSNSHSAEGNDINNAPNPQVSNNFQNPSLQLEEREMMITKEYQYQTNLSLSKIQEYADLMKSEFLLLQQQSHEYRVQLQREYELALQNNMVEMVQMRQQMYDLDSQYSRWLEQSQQELIQQAMQQQQQWQQQQMIPHHHQPPVNINSMPVQNHQQDVVVLPAPPQKRHDSVVMQEREPVVGEVVKQAKSEAVAKAGFVPVEKENVASAQKPTSEGSVVEQDHYIIEETQRSNHYKPIPPFLLDLDSNAVAAPFKKQTDDYYILYNPAFPPKNSLEIELHSTLNHDSVVCCVQFNRDGTMVATGTNKITMVYSTNSGGLLYCLNSETNSVSTTPAETTSSGDLYIRAVCFSPDGTLLANGTEDKIIRIWNLKEQKIVKMLKGHDQDIYSLEFTPDGKKLVSGSGDKTVRVWDLEAGLASSDVETSGEEQSFKLDDGVTTVAVSPDSQFIAAGSLDRTIRIWKLATGELVDRLDSEIELGTGHKDSVYSIAFTHDGKQLVSGSLDRSIKLWDLKTFGNDKEKSKCMVTYTGHRDFVLSVATTNDDRFVFSGSKDRGVIVWDKESGNPLLMLQGHKNSVIGVAVAGGAPLGSEWDGIFATGSGDCKARVWKWKQSQ